MKLLADQNVEMPVIARLREAGYDVWAVAERARGVSDPVVLGIAEEQQRILLTNDKDFADLLFLQRKTRAGVILVRMPTARSVEKAERLLEVLRTMAERLDGSLTVVTPSLARRRPIPARWPQPP